MTIRLTDEQAAQLDVIARVLGSPISELLRHAVDGYISSTCRTHEFQLRLKQHVEDDQEVVRQLTNPERIPCGCSRGQDEPILLK